MNIIILGHEGMLGSDIQLELTKYDHLSVFGYDRDDVDITSASSVSNLSKKHKNVDIVINCAAYTAVDDCETNKDLAMTVNGAAMEHISNFCNKHEAVLIHFSTDYVFDGTKHTPYVEDDTTNPISVYGESKLLAETLIKKSGCNHYIFRVQWLYGENGHHFIKTIKKLAETKDTISVVNDQWGAPTSTVSLAKEIGYVVIQTLTAKQADSEEAMGSTVSNKKSGFAVEGKETASNNLPVFGTYHLASPTYTNWYEYACFLVKHFSLDLNIEPTTSEQFVRPAARPKNGKLNAKKWLNETGRSLPDWVEDIKNLYGN